MRVEAYHGESDNGDHSQSYRNRSQRNNRADNNGSYIYQGAIPATESGAYGFSVRVVPTHPQLMQTHELRLITWS